MTRIDKNPGSGARSAVTVRGLVKHYGETKAPELYRIPYDGSIADEPHFVVMGGTTEPIITALKDTYTENADLADAVKIAVDALRVGIASNGSSSGSGSGSTSSSSPGSAEPRTLDVSTLEVAILDANRPRRAFRRIAAPALEALLPQADPVAEESASPAE